MNNTLEYKGYYSNVEYSAKDGVFHGKIEGINDLVTFEGKNTADIENEFRRAVDDYLNFCKSVGKAPGKTWEDFKEHAKKIDARVKADIEEMEALALKTAQRFKNEQ